MTSEKNRPVKY